MSLPSIILIPLLAGALLAAGWCITKMLGGVTRGPQDLEISDDDGTVIDLEDAKLRLLLTLKDLEQDHAMGKLSEADYRELKDRYEREVIGILDALSELEAGSGVLSLPGSWSQDEVSGALAFSEGAGAVSSEEE